MWRLFLLLVLLPSMAAGQRIDLQASYRAETMKALSQTGNFDVRISSGFGVNVTDVFGLGAHYNVDSVLLLRFGADVVFRRYRFGGVVNGNFQSFSRDYNATTLHGGIGMRIDLWKLEAMPWVGAYMAGERKKRYLSAVHDPWGFSYDSGVAAIMPEYASLDRDAMVYNYGIEAGFLLRFIRFPYIGLHMQIQQDLKPAFFPFQFRDNTLPPPPLVNAYFNYFSWGFAFFVSDAWRGLGKSEEEQLQEEVITE